VASHHHNKVATNPNRAASHHHNKVATSLNKATNPNLALHHHLAATLNPVIHKLNMATVRQQARYLLLVLPLGNASAQPL
jgi:hypothetical protein